MFASPGAIVFQFGPLAVRWYGLLIATGVMLGTSLAHREAIRRGQDPDRLLNLIIVTVLSALGGARLYYVLFNWDYYGAQPQKIFAIWEGGLAIHGGLIAGALATLIYCRVTGLSVLLTMDILAPGVAIGQAIGRWGNFFNQEAFGVPTDLPWKLYIDPYHRPPDLKAFDYFHPTFLYESLWNLLVFCVVRPPEAAGGEAGSAGALLSRAVLPGPFLRGGAANRQPDAGQPAGGTGDESPPRGGIGGRARAGDAQEIGGRACLPAPVRGSLRRDA
jgi:hypothetical protein